MLNPRDYWESRFRKMDIGTYGFSQSKPSGVLAGFCENYLKGGATVLDLGCGGGRNAHYLAREGYQVYGVDIAAEAVEFCRKRFARYDLSGTFAQGTFEHIPYPDDYFVAVICIAVLDHATVETAQVAMVEIRRGLVPNGVILLTFDPPDQDEGILDKAEVLPDDIGHIRPPKAKAALIALIPDSFQLFKMIFNAAVKHNSFHLITGAGTGADSWFHWTSENAKSEYSSKSITKIPGNQIRPPGIQRLQFTPTTTSLCLSGLFRPCT